MLQVQTMLEGGTEPLAPPRPRLPRNDHILFSSHVDTDTSFSIRVHGGGFPRLEVRLAYCEVSPLGVLTPEPGSACGAAAGLSGLQNTGRGPWVFSMPTTRPA